jgi:hypothetical protein
VDHKAPGLRWPAISNRSAALPIKFNSGLECIYINELADRGLREMDSDQLQKFRELLEDTYQWPDYYEFKFIVKMDDRAQVLDKLSGFTFTETPSKKGNYVSVNARKLMKTSQEVLDVYEVMSTIKGIISL